MRKPKKNPLEKICQTGIPGYDAFATAEEGEWFDIEAAQDAVDFFPDCLTHADGPLAGKPFVLEDWEKAIVGNLFGWKKFDAQGRERRRYSEVLLYVARKNGKTPLAAGICLYVLFIDAEVGAQIFSVAGDTDQATELYNHARAMVENEPELASRAKIFTGKGSRCIENVGTRGRYRVLSSDAPGKHGKNLSLGLIDELHVQSTADLVYTFRTSMASTNRLHPLLIYMTTADWERESICNTTHKHACNVRDGVTKDSSFLPVIYEIVPDENTPKDYFKQKKYWKLANPNLGVSVSEDYLKRESIRAETELLYHNTFLRLNLNVKTQTSGKWLDMVKWDASAGVVSAPKLLGRVCYGGLDLGSTSDFTSFCLAFPEDDGTIKALWWHWLPQGKVYERQFKARLDIPGWVNGDWLEITEGDEIDYDHIRMRINAIGKQYEIAEIACDRLFQGAGLMQGLIKDGFEAFKHGQGFYSMAAPTVEFEERINRGTFHHGGNPVVRHMATCAVVASDAADCIKPDRKKSSDKIDGIVTGVMALGRAVVNEKTPSAYRDRGILTVEM